MTELIEELSFIEGLKDNEIDISQKSILTTATLKTNAEASDKAILLTPKGTLTIGEEYSSPSISFYKNDEVEDVVTIYYTKFMYKGEEVKELQTIYDIIKPLTSIELPSDEEMEQEAQKRHPYEKHMGATWENGLHEGFIMGAEWIKEQLNNQNK